MTRSTDNRPTKAASAVSDDVCSGGDQAQANTTPRGIRQRRNEQIGGGYFIFRRGKTTGRIKTGHIRRGALPFEHPSLESAMAEAHRLLVMEPDAGSFDVFARVASVRAVEPQPSAAEPQP